MKNVKMFLFLKRRTGIDSYLLKNLNASYKININSNVESLNVATTLVEILYEINRRC